MNIPRIQSAGACLFSLLLSACASSERGADPDQASDVRTGYFFVGGRYVEGKTGPLMQGQAYVEYQLPPKRMRPYPVVMIHGAAQTGSNFTGTPDGRKGWAQYFVEQGYAVYVIDQPARGRSAWTDGMGGLTRFPASQIEQRFTAPEKFNLWPQAKQHTQW